MNEKQAGSYDTISIPITAPATPEAKQWQGWGTALKPALEPITVARKPLIGTVAENVLQHGTGAINVDGGRVGTDDNLNGGGYSGGTPKTMFSGLGRLQPDEFVQPAGRWPANFIHDGSEEATDLLGASARFFYCAKASKADRDENHHPTVKPTDLMRYLCRLVTPPSGTVLDPFMGSGSTGKAAMLEGFAFVGIEREAEYIDIAKARIQSAVGLL
jgi:site-specific DNA-methyltransferase (adenine-specific)